MNKLYLSSFMTRLLMGAALPVNAGERAALRTPQSGVLCDNYLCASDEGVSRELTENNLG
ncbi:YcgJ family protein [Pseudomonas sp. PDM25]|uniref:YcgJ family protein n=1 Tax=Pseudomonas sp. PDM25 TaxID=2854772 RepID=UPI001C489B1D|nr:hypothetical protein [Pseudomonas sp. PDM25]